MRISGHLLIATSLFAPTTAATTADPPKLQQRGARATAALNWYRR
jgi:hypothetical protein